MVFEHQTHMTNLLTRLNWLSRIGDAAQVEAALRETVDYLRFKDEAPLAEPVEGVSSFTRTFAARGPLREFDLKTRLFRSPVSYMIYSASFRALPEGIRRRIEREVEAGR